MVALARCGLSTRFEDSSLRVVRHRYGAYDLRSDWLILAVKAGLVEDYDDGAFAEIALLKRHKLVPGSKVFNAGANQCVQTMMMAKRAWDPMA